jgi:putative hemolysin
MDHSHGSVLALILSAGMAFVVSFLCSLMEAALLSLTPGQLADLERSKPRAGQILRRFKEQVEQPITVILMLNTTAHTVGATVAGAQCALIFGNKALGVFSALFTYLMLQYTEVLPKSVGVRFSRPVAVWMAAPLLLLVRLLSPLIAVIQWVNRPFEGREKQPGTGAHLDELRALAGYARLAKLISPHQESIITRATRLSQKTARDFMIPAEQITFLSDSQTLADAVVTAHLDPHTRFPIMEGANRNKVLGYINFKELVYRVRTNPTDPTVKGIIRPLRFVRPDAPCQQIMKAFVEEHEHMAIVQNEHGESIGLITLEDLVEELLGDLEDEFDHLPKMCHALTGGVWIVGGGVPMRELAEKINLPILAADGPLSAWMINRFGRMPAIDERLHVNGLEFNVRRLRRGKIFEVLISPKSVPPLAHRPAVRKDAAAVAPTPEI